MRKKLKYEYDDYCITASTQKGDIIGTLNLDCIEEEDQEYYLMISIEVNEKYRGYGIGKRLIHTAVKNLEDQFKICNLKRFSEKDHSSTLTNDGARLVMSCFKRGIITEENLTEYGAVDIQVPVIESDMEVKAEDAFNSEDELGLYEPAKSKGKQVKLTDFWNFNNSSDSIDEDSEHVEHVNEKEEKSNPGKDKSDSFDSSKEKGVFL